MFKVLTGETKRRGISPATIIASVGAHLLLLGGAVFASGGEPAATGPIEADTIILWDADEAPPPPKPVIDRPTPPAPAQPDAPDQPVETPEQGNQEEIEQVTEAPDGIKDEEPGAEPVDITRHTGVGEPGDNPGPAVGDSTPPAGDGNAGPKVFDVTVVEVRPVLDSRGLARTLERNYPAVLRDSRVSGRVIVEIVVDEDGHAVPGSARVIEASHPAFGEATLRVADRFRFRPARINGNAVAVVVTIPIVWTAN